MASVTNVMERTPFGELISNNYSSSQQIPTEFGFTGHKWDENNSLTYLHARYMLNENKVFLSQDPVSITGFNTDYFLLNPQYQNAYAYSANDPVNKVDPDGKAVALAPILWTAGAGFSSGFGISFALEQQLNPNASFGALMYEGFKGGVIGAVSGGAGTIVKTASVIAKYGNRIKILTGAVGAGTSAAISSSIISETENRYNNVSEEYQGQNTVESLTLGGATIAADMVPYGLGKISKQPLKGVLKNAFKNTAFESNYKEVIQSSISGFANYGIKSTVNNSGSGNYTAQSYNPYYMGVVNINSPVSTTPTVKATSNKFWK